MKKRILSILVICCMVLGLLPMTTFANNGGAKAIQLGTSGISGYDSTNSSYDYIYFGAWNSSPVKWRVLDTKTNMPNAQEGDGFFLLSDALLGTGEFGGVEFDYTTPYFNDWKGSRAQDWCNDFYSRSLSITEQKAVLATSKSDALYGMYYDASDNILDGDKVFFLSAEEAENAAYGFTDDNARIANYGDSAGVWWLRSPRKLTPDFAGTVNKNGAVIGEWVNQTTAARPAFNLKPDSVLLVTAAAGGKGTADGMFKIPEYSGDEWKLTLLDDTRTFKVAETTAAGKPGGTVTLNFSDPRTGLNEYISAIIEGENGAAYYGRIMKPTATDRQLSFTLPHDLASGNYKLHVFSEQCNGDYQTDYASQFQTVALTVEEAATEQFALTPGGTYYFDLSGENIPGTVNDDLPDKTMHYVPFTYAGTVDAYKLTSEMATTEEYAQQNEYTHSLFVADYAVTHTASWNTLNNASLIFGKGYAAGGVDYTLRAPSEGSDKKGSDKIGIDRCTPQSNEWDRILDKNDGYIKNWKWMYSWGQDTSRNIASQRALRGSSSNRRWHYGGAVGHSSAFGFRPVLEVLDPDTLSSDGLKAVTLDLGGGKLGGSSEAIQIIVKNGESFTAPASDGLSRPDGDTGSSFMWLGSDGKRYAPGDNVPADVTKLTAQFVLVEQFSLAPGGVYYFDLSGAGIPGTVNDALPDSTMHYVPFTYAGTVDAYKLTSEMATTEEYAQKNEYVHSLFVADYAVTHKASWNTLNNASLIFGKGYAAGGMDYTLRTPSVGSDGTGSGNSQRCTPQSNEWDRILDKNSGYIKNWSAIYSWGQDTASNTKANRALRGYGSTRYWNSYNAITSHSGLGFRPVLEVLNPDTMGSDRLKVVTLDLGGGKLGGSSETIQIIVKNGESFTAPASDGLTRPDGNTGSYFKWRGSDGKLYAPGSSVPAEVTRLTAQFGLTEQFTLAPGGTYYFDLSGAGIPGTANGSLPDASLHYVPFTYAGTVDAYKLASAMATTEEYAQQNKYAHSLFVADYVVTHTVGWDNLDDASLIFGKNYATGGISYTLRAPSTGSDGTGSGNSRRGTPQSNEWDRILDKDDGYIKNCGEVHSWGQDTDSSLLVNRARRGYNSARNWSDWNATWSRSGIGFRPVLEVLNPKTLGADGLKAITLDLGGGKLGNSSEDIQIIVKNGESFTAPASDGLTRPDGNTGSYFKWRGSDGKLYAPGSSVPAEVTRLTAQFGLTEQFTLAPGGTYYFDLSGAGIPGTANGSLPDASLHYVPFTYAGTVDAYKLASAMAPTDEYAEKHKYLHSLFVADFAVTHTISWENLNAAGLIFGKNYAAGGVEYTLRAPSAGRSYAGSGESVRGNPQSNEWDKILDKYDGYIKNWSNICSWGQDAAHNYAQGRANRGYSSIRNWSFDKSSNALDFRPVMEVLNPDTLGTDGLKAVTLDLGGGKLGGSYEDIKIIVKKGSGFTAPASDGLTRPDGDNGSYFMWRGSNGKLYAPGDNVPADVDKLTALFDDSGSHTVTITTDALPDGKVGEAYSQTLAADGTAPITWSISGGALSDGLKLDGNTGEISGKPTAEGTATFTVKAENSGGSDTKELSITITKDTPVEHTVTVKTDGKGTAFASPDKAAAGTEITLTATPDTGYRFREWQVIDGGVTIQDDKFTMPDKSVEVKAVFEEDTPTTPTDPAKPGISVTGTYTYNGSQHTVTVTGYDSATMEISGDTATDAGDYTVRVTSRTGKWADGSTEAVTAAWSIRKATQEAPAGLAGVAPTTEGGNDGKITGVTDKMEYRMAGDSSYTACGGTEIENLSAGNYFVRYAGDNNHFASPDGEVTAGDGTPLADCAITFNTGGGSGGMSPVTVKEGTNYILPACGFTAPTDQEFKAWEIGGTEYQVGDSYTVNGDTEIKALWKDSVIPPAEYTVTVKTEGSGTASASPAMAVAGREITLTATPDTDWHFKEWQVIDGGVTITSNKFTMPDKSVEVKAIFEKDAPPAPTEYTVTFDGNDGTPSVSTMTTTGQKLGSLPDASRSSHSFNGWYTEKSGGTKITTDTVFSGNTTVYAQWTYSDGGSGSGGGGGGYNPPVTYYTLHFETGGGSDIPSLRDAYNAYIDLTRYVSTRQGHTFTGWYSQRSLVNKVSGVYLTGDMTVYAGWKLDEKPGTGEAPVAPASQQDGTHGDAPKTAGNDSGQSRVEEQQPVSPDTPENVEQQIPEEQNREEQVTGEQIPEEQAVGGQTTGVPTTEDTGEEQKATEENSPVDNSPADNGSNPDDSEKLQSGDNSHSGGWIPVVGVSTGALVTGYGLYLGFRKWKK